MPMAMDCDCDVEDEVAITDADRNSLMCCATIRM